MKRINQRGRLRPIKAQQKGKVSGDESGTDVFADSCLRGRLLSMYRSPTAIANIVRQRCNADRCCTGGTTLPTRIRSAGATRTGHSVPGRSFFGATDCCAKRPVPRRTVRLTVTWITYGPVKAHRDGRCFYERKRKCSMVSYSAKKQRHLPTTTALLHENLPHLSSNVNLGQTTGRVLST